MALCERAADLADLAAGERAPGERERAAHLRVARVDRLAHRQRHDAVRSRPVASASPTRRIVSASSWRLRSTSSIFASSWTDMSLNSRPSSANSSLPVERDELLEVAARQAAAPPPGRSLSGPLSARLTKPAEISASSTNRPTRSAMSRRLLAMCSENEAVGVSTPSRTGGPAGASIETNLPR